MTKSLRSRMLRGAAWALIEKVGNQGISFLVFMFVARLIGPKEYGLANICFVTFTLANLFILGVVDGIVSLQIKDSKRLSTLFWFVMAFGLSLTLICMVGAGSFAAVMSEPRLGSLLRWFSIIFICLSLSVVPNKLIYASLNFKIIAIRTLFASVISGAVGVYMALSGFGAYAIVAQQITLYSMMNVVVWHYVDWRPSFTFDASVLKSSIFPGFKTVGTDLLAFSDDQLPRLFIGSVLGPIALGYYAFVTRIRYAMLDMLINPCLTVLYPALAQIKENHSEQRIIVGQLIGLMGVLIFPVLGLGIAAAPLYVPLFLGEAWSPAIPILQIFIGGSAVLPIIISVRETFRAHNRMGSYVKIQMPIVVIGLLLMLLLLPNGLVVMAVSAIITAVCSIPVYAFFLKRWIGISLWGPIARLYKPLCAVGIMLFSIQMFQAMAIYPENSWYRLLGSVVIGGSVYLGASFFLQYKEVRKMIVFLINFRNKQRFS